MQIYNKSKENLPRKIIFETPLLVVRNLTMSDIEPYHKMQSNPRVMQYVTGKVQSRKAHEKELLHLVSLYDKKRNDFWIYGVERKLDAQFVGTLALVKDQQDDDEIGYRFLEKYWQLGYGYELCKEAILYCKSIGISKLVGYVAKANVASLKILEKCNFKYVQDGVDAKTKLPESKYELFL